MPALFITATGTNIGKTRVATLMLQQLIAKGHAPFALKPVISGFDENSPSASDTGQLIAAMGQMPSPTLVETVSPWRFSPAISPHLAAARTETPLTVACLANYCRKEINAHTITVIEGAGGVMAPINEKETMREWIAALKIPFVLVAGTYLGTFSHTLTALEALKAKHLVPAGIILSESEETSASFEEIKASLQQYVPDRTPILFLPRIPLDAATTKADNEIPDLTVFFDL